MVEIPGLPSGIVVFERGWLSANNILFQGSGGAALVDSGYCTHAEQTLALVQRALGERPLDLLLNTHLHSDHCGGNAALQMRYPAVQTRIPPGQAEFVRNWDPVALTYVPTGQQCPPFKIEGLLQPGKTVLLGDRSWQIHGSPGHDPHSVILFEAESRTLISADSLWENGFGVVFQELEGERAFDEVAETLDLIETLDPLVVIPGHGKVFTHVAQSLAAARRRLDGFVRDPMKHATHAAKVLLKFKLLEFQRLSMAEFTRWASATAYFGLVHQRWFSEIEQSAWIAQLADDLVRAGAARREGEYLLNA
ncbi:MBL fold metallo-hydrolase [Caenimonas soli]|uniref:MBL fold metallo-hydrolase n=1 Tax=Caenimonas soli TaxID=2735555 RepID=UPI0015577DC7|nr:MBL fold metallo-hydrolase [Caenimonas soli]NPC58137.1 MBL fold metallo-hydrolase [Caenimonas soli]